MAKNLRYCDFFLGLLEYLQLQRRKSVLRQIKLPVVFLNRLNLLLIKPNYPEPDLFGKKEVRKDFRKNRTNVPSPFSYCAFPYSLDVEAGLVLLGGIRGGIRYQRLVIPICRLSYPWGHPQRWWATTRIGELNTLLGQSNLSIRSQLLSILGK